MKYTSLFVVLSPFQIMCAQEARDRFCPGEPCHLVVIDREPEDSPAMSHKLAVIDDRWKKVTRLREMKPRGLRKSLLRIWLTLRLLRAHGPSRGKVFLGDPLIKWFQLIGKILGREVTWLDDGAASLFVLETPKCRTYLSRQNPSLPRYFTIFATSEMVKSSDGRIVLNDFRHRQAARQDQKVDPDQIWFIGQWISERGGVTLADELATFRNAANMIAPKRFRYVPHRHESEEKLRSLAQFCDVSPLPTTLEHYLCEQNTLPQTIYSYYSTALFTVPKLFPAVHAVGVQVPYSAASVKQATEWETVYRHMDRTGIPVLFRNNQ